MQRILAVCVLVLGLAAPMTAVAQVDAGGTDGGTVDAGGAVPDAAPSAPDARPGAGFPPALDDEDGCDCALVGAGSGAGLAVLIGAVAIGLRRRRR